MLIHSKYIERFTIITSVVAAILAVVSAYFFYQKQMIALLPLLLFSIICVMVSILSKVHASFLRQAENEAEELSELAEKGGIFDEGESHINQSALKQFERVLIPITVSILGIAEAVLAVYLFRQTQETAVVFSGTDLKTVAAILFVATIVLYLGGSYLAGFAYQKGITVLRAVSSELTGLSFIALASSVVYLMRLSSLDSYELLFCKLFAVVLMIRGIEKLLAVIIEFYRPRNKELKARLLYEARLNSLFSQPQSILKNVSEALNYQFGVNINEKLILRFIAQMIPLVIIVNVLILMLFSSIVILDTEEQAVIERLGQPKTEKLNAGIHFKLPWPVDKVYRQNVRERHMMDLGINDVNKQNLVLWGNTANINNNQKSDKLDLYFVPGEKESGQDIMLLATGFTIHYRISDLYNYIYESESPDQIMLKSVQRQLFKYLASNNLIESYDRAAMNKAVISKIDLKNIGITVEAIDVRYIQQPINVVDSYRRIARMKEDARIILMQAKANKTQSDFEAQIIANKILLEAEIYKFDRLSSNKSQLNSYPHQLKLYTKHRELFRARKYYESLAKFRNSKKIILATDVDSEAITVDLKKSSTELFDLSEELKDE